MENVICLYDFPGRLLVLCFFLVILPSSLFSFHTKAFAPRPAFFKPALVSSTELLASRINAKKEKIKRNRENMRKFSTPGRRGTSRRKTLKKVLSSRARQSENEFIAKCFITGPAPNEGSEN